MRSTTVDPNPPRSASAAALSCRLATPASPEGLRVIEVSPLKIAGQGRHVRAGGRRSGVESLDEQHIRAIGDELADARRQLHEVNEIGMLVSDEDSGGSAGSRRDLGVIEHGFTCRLVRVDRDDRGRSSALVTLSRNGIPRKAPGARWSATTTRPAVQPGALCSF